jgi:ABC-type bacteriocin/lantibiotic exporter with double-glycine peptidase domain
MTEDINIKAVQTIRLWLLRISNCFAWTLVPAIRIHRHCVPLILQLTTVECGAACLAMILSHYGCKTSVAKCREWLSVGRDGVTAKGIAEAARHYGLRVKAFSLEPADFKYVSLPAIAHWDFNHFVVVERWSPRVIEILDPAQGRRRLTAEEFDASFTGVVLTFEPGFQFQRHATSRASWRSYLKHMFLHMEGTPGLLAQILSTSVFLQILGLAMPVFTKVLVDQVLPLHITSVLTMLSIGIIILVLAQMVSNYLRAALLIYLRGRLDSQMMVGFFEHVLALPFSFFQQRSSGDLLMRLGSNMIIREVLTSQIISSVLDGTLVLVYLVVLLVWEPFFGLLALGIGLFQVAILVCMSQRVRSLMRQDLTAQAKSQSYLVEALSGIATLKASGAEDRALDHWSNLFYDHLNVSLQRSHLSAIIETAMTMLRTFSPLLLMWVGALYVLNGSMSLGTLLALNALAMSFLTPLASLVSNVQQLQLVGAHFDRITDVVEMAPEQHLGVTQTAPKLPAPIELKQVNFRYSPDKPWVLHDVSVTIQPGQKVALVGRTGSGKSTLAQLLLGLYTPTEGEILYGGVPLEGLNYRKLRSQFGVVLQEPFLFSGSIRQNIAFNDPSLSLEQVMEAARIAAIHDEIMQMPMGYETLVAEGGTALSGGQRQRIALARAVAHNPAILVLDEATSHLDTVTEDVVEQNLRDLSCTRIVIAHRLNTARNADLILALDNGVIVERGLHQELLAREGYYAQLVQSQLAGGEIVKALLT